MARVARLRLAALGRAVLFGLALSSAATSVAAEQHVLPKTAQADHEGRGVEAIPLTSSSVEVPLRDSLVVALPGASHVLVIDDTLAQAELVSGGVRFSGLQRGESVAFVWVGGTRLDLLVRVVLPPPAPASTALSREQVARVGQGHAGSSAQLGLKPSGDRIYSFQHAFDWMQEVNGRRLVAYGRAQDASAEGVPFNLSTLSMRYATPSASLTLFDFGLALNGGTAARVTRHAPLNAYVFRGLEASIARGANQLQLFGGTSIPSYFRALEGTQAIAGVNVNRRVSPGLYLYSTTAAVSVPGRDATDPAGRREGSLFHTSGFAYQPDGAWATQATGGASNRGFYGDGTVAFERRHLTAWVAGATSSPEFPLNQMQLLSGGGSSARASATWEMPGRVTASLFYQHSTIRAAPRFSSFAGTSDYVNPNLNLRLTDRQTLTLSGAESRSIGGGAGRGRTLMRSLSAAWTSRWRGGIANSLRASSVRAEDPAQLDAGVRLSMGNDLNVRIRGGYLSVGVQHNHRDPSLATRLRQQLGLLPAHLQELFLTDPVAFVESPHLPADVRDLLGSLQSADSAVSVSGQFQPARRLNVSLNYRLLRGSHGADRRGRTNALGYVLSYQLTPSLQLRSSLSDTYHFDSRRSDVARTTTFVVGLSKAFRGSLSWLMPASSQLGIDGRVFVDRNTTGTHDPGEPGLAGLEVLLDDGRRTVTDADGRFRFTDLRPGAYRVSLPLGQFSDPVRMTTLTSVPVDLFDGSRESIEFGVVNFARLLGRVYNDYANEGTARADAPGLQNVTVVVTGADGVERHAVTDGAGEYRIDDLAPGSYRVEADPATIPPNFIRAIGLVAFDLRPTRTSIVDLPVRALRSVSGHVYLRADASQDSEPAHVPVAGVTVVVGPQRSTTDAAGRFLLRDLPAGEVTVTLEAVRPMPPGMAPPSGRLHLSREPVRVDNAVITLHSPELLEYLEDSRVSRRRR